MNYENELVGIAYTVVPRPEYPEPAPTLDKEIAAKRDEIKMLHENRPATKQEYLLQLATLRGELTDLIERNNQIRADNTDARAAVDAAYQASVEAAKLDPENQWAAIRIVRGRLLAACDWTQVVDAPLTDEQKIVWQAYRQALRDLPQTYSDPDTVAWPEPPGD